MAVDARRVPGVEGVEDGGSHEAGFWQASGRLLTGFWQASGRLLAGFWQGGTRGGGGSTVVVGGWLDAGHVGKSHNSQGFNIRSSGSVAFSIVHKLLISVSNQTERVFNIRLEKPTKPYP